MCLFVFLVFFKFRCDLFNMVREESVESGFSVPGANWHGHATEVCGEKGHLVAL